MSEQNLPLMPKDPGCAPATCSARDTERVHCPHCKMVILWSEDRGAHCDGCDNFDPEADLPNANLSDAPKTGGAAPCPSPRVRFKALHRCLSLDVSIIVVLRARRSFA